MKKYLIYLLFIFVIACSGSEREVNKNIISNKIELNKELTFEEYVYLLIKKNYSNKYPDINNIPE